MPEQGSVAVDPVALRLLADAAPTVHGPSPVEEKVTWVVEAARALADSSVAVYVDLRADSPSATTASGASAVDVDRFALPAVRAVLDRGPEVAVPSRGGELLADPRFLTFLDRAGLRGPNAVAGLRGPNAVAGLRGPNAAAGLRGPNAVAGLSDQVSALLVPVLGSDRLPHGALLVLRPEPFHADEEAGVEALAAHLGVAFDNAETFTRLTELQAAQREVVHQLQEAVRPPMPEVPSAELGVHYVPADPGAPTGGDLYDWLVLPNGDLHLAVVDVMGKGVAATKDAVGVTHALRMLALDGCSMDRLVARAGALVSSQNPELVATVLVARYRPADGVVQLAGGGHPPALLVCDRGPVRLVSAPGAAIGWPGAGSNEVVSLVLERRDTLVLYTDGLIEASKDILVGLDGLAAAAAQTAQYPAPHLARALVERALSGAERRDDSVALVLRRRTPPPPTRARTLGPFEYRFSPSPATIPLSRHLFADWVEHLALDDGERSDLLLVVSELCSNAVRHASGAPGSLVLRAWAEGDAVVVEVEDDGAGFELHGRYDDETPDPGAERGRGLYVVEALTDEMSVRRNGGSTVVRAVRRAVIPERLH